MKNMFPSLLALTLGCAPKAPTLASPVQPEARARALANFLVEKGAKEDNLSCQQYTNTDNGETSKILACYMSIEADHMYADSLVLSFSNKPFIYVDKKADDSLDEIILQVDVPVNVPLEVFTEQDQIDARSNYADVLESLYTATFNSEEQK